MRNAYYLLPEAEQKMWWCLVHKRIATHLWFSEGMQKVVVHCDPDAGGILINCRCVPISRRKEYETATSSY